MMRYSHRLIVAVALTLAGCVAKPAAVAPTPAQQAEVERARQEAKAQAEAAEALRKRRQQRKLAVSEFISQYATFHDTLAALQRWDAAGDERIEPIAGVLAVAKQLPTLEPLRQACGLRFHALVERAEPLGEPPELPGQVRLACDLTARAQTIAQRQVLNHVRVFLGLPPWLTDVATRYQQRGWVAWNQLLELMNLELAFERQAGPWRAAAAAVGAVISPETLLKPGLEGRRNLLIALQKGTPNLGFPSSFDDKQLAADVRRAWPELAPLGPLAPWRGALLEVRALDPQWQPLVGEPGRPSRAQRDFAASFESTATERPYAGCWILWGTAERSGKEVRVRLADDLRQVRCPRAPIEPAKATVTQK